MLKTISFAIGFIAFAVAGSISLINSQVASKSVGEIQNFVWIKYDCGLWGKAIPSTISQSINATQVSETEIPVNSPFSNCFPKGSNVCAVRFSINETEPIPGFYGHSRPKAQVNAWDGNHKVMYCY